MGRRIEVPQEDEPERAVGRATEIRRTMAAYSAIQTNHDAAYAYNERGSEVYQATRRVRLSQDEQLEIIDKFGLRPAYEGALRKCGL